MRALERDELEEILDLILWLRTDPMYPSTKNGCWCSKGIDHPLVSRHDKRCLEADILVEGLRGRLGITGDARGRRLDSKPD